MRPAAIVLSAAVLVLGGCAGQKAATPQLYRAAAKASSRRLVLLPGDLHGTGLLTGPNGAKVRSMTIDFLPERGHAP